MKSLYTMNIPACFLQLTNSMRLTPSKKFVRQHIWAWDQLQRSGTKTFIFTMITRIATTTNSLQCRSNSCRLAKTSSLLQLESLQSFAAACILPSVKMWLDTAGLHDQRSIQSRPFELFATDHVKL